MKTHRILAIVSLGLAAAMSLPAAAFPDADVDVDKPFDVADAFSLAIHQETSKDVAGEPRMSMHELEGAIDMSVRAKMFVSNKTPYNHVRSDGSTVEGATLQLYGVYRGVPKAGGSDFVNGVPENQIFGEATPMAEVRMTIVNPDAHKQFEVGKEYYVDLSPAPSTS